MLACMLVLSAPRSTSLVLAYHAYGTASAMTLLVLRLLRVARNMYSRRGLRSLVLGPGSVVSSLVNVRSSAGVFSTIICSGGGGIDVDGTAAAEVFFFGGMLMKGMKI